jgi:hypothetical protein
MRRRWGIAGGILVGLLALLWWLLPGRGDGGAPARSGRARLASPTPGPSAGDPLADGTPAGGEPPPAARGGDASVGGEDGPDELTDEQLAARARELEASPDTHVICDLGLPIRSGTAYLAIGDPADRNGRVVEVVNGVAYLPLVYDLGSLGDAVFEDRTGVFALEGYGPGPIAWGDRPEGGGKGRCSAPITPELGRASLTGLLTLAGSGAPAAGGWVEGCGNLAFADGNGIVHMDILPAPCSVLAMRQDGALRTVSEAVDVVPVPGGDVVVDLTLPDAPKAGLGVRIAAAEGGIQVEGVVDGGPAQAAGLEPGDLVVQIDGQPATDVPEFVALAGGPAGSSVVLTVERGGERLEVTVVRGSVPG